MNIFNEDSRLNSNHIESLKTVINKRLDEELISTEAIERLIHYSGGILRDLIKFMQDACKLAITSESKEINKSIATGVVKDKIGEIDRLFDQTKYKQAVLEIIDSKNKAHVENETLVYLLEHLFVLQYGIKGKRIWYDAHPCLKALLQGTL